MSTITVSVFMLTYNQEQYIAQAIESILMQKTSFNYQLVIGEDFSTDNTRQICEDYQKKYPSKIKLLPTLNKNVGLIANYMRTFKACNGKYIAICDGDDYWIDDLKLQKQVDFLDGNLGFQIVGSNYVKLFMDNRLVENENNRKKLVYDFDDLIFGNIIPSVTVLFRNVPQENSLPKWILNFPYGDWPTYLFVLKNGGKIHFLEDFTAVYRTDIGISAKIRKKHSETAKVNLQIIECIDSDSNFSHKTEVVKKSLLAHKKNLMACYNREKQYFKALNVLCKMFLSSKGTLNLVKFYMYSLKKSIK